MLSENIGAYVAVVDGAAITPVTAGGTGDATLVTGYTVNRNSYSTPLSAVLAIPYNATLAASKTLSLSYTIEGSASSDMSSPTTLASATTYVLVTSATASQTVSGVVEVNLNLRTAGQYLRAKFTPTHSATGTDTSGFGAVWVLGGVDSLPV